MIDIKNWLREFSVYIIGNWKKIEKDVKVQTIVSFSIFGFLPISNVMEVQNASEYKKYHEDFNS